MKKITLFCLIIFSSCNKNETVTPAFSDNFVGTYKGAYSENTASKFPDQHNITIKIIKLDNNKLNISYKDDVLYGGKSISDIYTFELVEVKTISSIELQVNENIFIYEDGYKKDVIINMLGKATKNGNSLSLIFENAYFSNNSKKALYLIKN